MYSQSVMYLSKEDLRLGPPTCYDWGFESRRVHGCLSLVNVGCFQVQIDLCDGPTECGVFGCDPKKHYKTSKHLEENSIL